jgi:hypothetical protein
MQNRPFSGKSQFPGIIRFDISKIESVFQSNSLDLRKPQIWLRYSGRNPRRQILAIMISLHELRIGNFIKGPLTLNGAFSQEFSAPESIEVALRLEHFIWFKADPGLYKLIQPIALTETWMQRFTGALDHELRWELHQYITVLKRYERYFLHYSDKGYLLDIKYVHQLQNLVLDLTGNELVQVDQTTVKQNN